MADRKSCTCPDWAPQIKRIDEPVVLAQIRAGRSLGPDHFKAWTFCPWCGATLSGEPADS